MMLPDLAVEQAEQAKWIFQILRSVSDAEPREIAHLPPPNPTTSSREKPNSRSETASMKSGPRRLRSLSTSGKKGCQGSSMACPTCLEPSRFQDRRNKKFMIIIN